MCGKGRVLLLVTGLVLSTAAAFLFGFTETEISWSAYMAVWLAGFAMIRLSFRRRVRERRV